MLGRRPNERLHSGYENIKVFEQSFQIPGAMAVIKKDSTPCVKSFFITAGDRTRTGTGD